MRLATPFKFIRWKLILVVCFSSRIFEVHSIQNYHKNLIMAKIFIGSISLYIYWEMFFFYVRNIYVLTTLCLRSTYKYVIRFETRFQIFYFKQVP